jgi:DNA anti-recombination protein RmuC
MALTTAQMQTNLDAANDAYAIAVNSQQYTVGNRSKTNQRLKELRQEIQFWSGEIAKAERGGIRMRGITTV